MNICVVIPLYNEESHVGSVLKSLKKYKLPVIVVDDGSNDRGAQIALNEGSLLLKHKINLGKGAAMTTGAVFAFGHGYDAIVYMDADGQHDPRDLPLFTELLNQKIDVVFGSRNLDGKAPFVRVFGNRIASLIIKILFGIYVTDPICGYRAISAAAYKKIKWETKGYGVETEMVARVAGTKLKFAEVRVKTIYHDKDKGVTILDAISILFEVLKWKIIKL